MSDPSIPQPIVRKPCEKFVVRLHRWLSLTFAAFWLIQSITGVLIMFHWEMDDARVPGAHRPTDLVAIEHRIVELAPSGSGKHVTSLWTTAGAPDRYDLTVEDTAHDAHAIRIAGDGTVLRDLGPGERSLMDTLVTIHQTLLAGDIGEWIVGISGIFLLSNLAIVLAFALPRTGQWRRTVQPRRNGARAARLYSWHRAVGLWAMLPAFCLIAAGTMLRFEDGMTNLLGAQADLPAATISARAVVPLHVAIRAAETALPNSGLTAVSFPDPADDSYRIRLLAPGERRRAYGTSIVVVDGPSGTVRAVAPAAKASTAKAFMDGLYAFHTGEFGGLIGRLLVLTLGLWLTTMIVLGILLWNHRRLRRRV
jgi:uncharacterized iron-regulated membrane protein